ncbi:ABATE domain-containing protein [Nonomuraea rubra]|uniref:ABATE domain-containing protein n=1 Tax=Nonomuraea rubra TaxID=46180 RepID=UPI00360C45F8
MAANDAWIRDGGRVCLDFVNTLRDRWDVPRETLEEPEDLVRWLHGAGLVVPGARLPAQPGAALRSARLLREAIDRAVLGAAGAACPPSRTWTRSTRRWRRRPARSSSS